MTPSPGGDLRTRVVKRLAQSYETAPGGQGTTYTDLMKAVGTTDHVEFGKALASLIADDSIIKSGSYYKVAKPTRSSGEDVDYDAVRLGQLKELRRTNPTYPTEWHNRTDLEISRDSLPKVVKIDIAQAGGTNLLRGTYMTVSAANAALENISRRSPTDGTYNKTDVTVHFSNGEQVKMRFDVKGGPDMHPHERDVDVLNHLMEYLVYLMSGEGMTEDEKNMAHTLIMSIKINYRPIRPLTRPWRAGDKIRRRSEYGGKDRTWDIRSVDEWGAVAVGTDPTYKGVQMLITDPATGITTEAPSPLGPKTARNAQTDAFDNDISDKNGERLQVGNRVRYRGRSVTEIGTVQEVTTNERSINPVRVHWDDGLDGWFPGEVLEKVFGAQSGNIARAAPSRWITRLIESSNDLTSSMSGNGHPNIKTLAYEVVVTPGFSALPLTAQDGILHEARRYLKPGVSTITFLMFSPSHDGEAYSDDEGRTMIVPWPVLVGTGDKAVYANLEDFVSPERLSDHMGKQVTTRWLVTFMMEDEY